MRESDELVKASAARYADEKINLSVGIALIDDDREHQQRHSLRPDFKIDNRAALPTKPIRGARATSSFFLLRRPWLGRNIRMSSGRFGETMKRYSVIFSVLPVIYLSSAMLGSNTAAQTAKQIPANSITLGIVSASHQREIEEHFRDFVSYVARKYFSASDAAGKVMIVSTLPELAKLLEQRKIDFYFESPYPTYIVNQVHGAGTLLLRRWKSGMAEYRSLIATGKDSGINRLDQLRGKIIGFKDPESTSGYFLPKLFLQRNGFKLAQASGPGAQVGAAEIGYVFANGLDRLYEMIFAKQVAAVTISDDDFATLDDKKKAQLNILAQTELLPRHLVSVRKDLVAREAERLAQLLQAMHEDGDGRRILQNADNTTKFDPLPGGEEAMRRRLLETFYAPAR
jgi:phosphonate transport system substrate-binding protein